MSIKSKLTGLGMPPALAVVNTGSVTTSLTATGTTQATALLVTDDNNFVTTTAANTGVSLRTDLSAGDTQFVANYGASTLSVYPPGTGKIQNGSASAAFSVATLKTAYFICLDGGANASFAAILSA